MANECHFTWDLEKNVIHNYHREKINHLKKEIEMDPDIKARGLITMAYFFAVQENPQFDESLKCLEEALEICDQLRKDHPEYEGYKIVALRNRAYVLKLAGKREDDTEAIIRETEILKPFSSTTLAGIHGLKGFTMILFTDEEHQKEGYRSYQDAVDLDPENFEWYLGMGILAKRLRILTEGNDSEPNEMEEDHLSKAVQLSRKKKPLPLALLADIYFLRGKMNDNIKDKLHHRAKEFYKEAYKLDPLNTHVLKRCGKAFSQMQEPVLAEKCLLKALELEPKSSIILHRLGNLYWKNNPLYPNFEKAETYLLKAISGEDRNLFAEMDLAYLRKRKDEKYDVLEHFKQCRKFYVDSPQCLKILDENIDKLKKKKSFLKTNTK